MKEIIIDDLNEQSPYESHYKRQANYYETDQMGIIHHSNYVRWFEEARMNFMEEIGFPYAKVEELGIIVPVLGVNCQFRTMVKFGDTVDIYTKITKFTGLEMNIEYRVVDHATGMIRCTGESSHAFLDKEYKPIRMKRDYPDLYEMFMNYVAVE